MDWVGACALHFSRLNLDEGDGSARVRAIAVLSHLSIADPSRAAAIRKMIPPGEVASVVALLVTQANSLMAHMVHLITCGSGESHDRAGDGTGASVRAAKAAHDVLALFDTDISESYYAVFAEIINTLHEKEVMMGVVNGILDSKSKDAESKNAEISPWAPPPKKEYHH